MKSKLLIFIALAFLTLPVGAASTALADSAYNKKNYAEAETLYSKILETEGPSAGLLYNLGNTYYRLGKDGEAMLCFERAKKLSPGDKMINQNLNFLRNKVLDANKGELRGKAGNLDPDPENFMMGIYNLIAVETQSNYWAVFAVMSFILFLGGLALYMFTPNVLARKTGFFSALTFFIFTVIFLIFAYLGAREYKRQDQVILTDFTTELLNEPKESGASVSTSLHKGTKLQILETQKGPDGEEWLKVKLNSENVGWIKKKSAEVI